MVRISKNEEEIENFLDFLKFQKENKIPIITAFLSRYSQIQEKDQIWHYKVETLGGYMEGKIHYNLAQAIAEDWGYEKSIFLEIGKEVKEKLVKKYGEEVYRILESEIEKAINYAYTKALQKQEKMRRKNEKLYPDMLEKIYENEVRKAFRRTKEIQREIK